MDQNDFVDENKKPPGTPRRVFRRSTKYVMRCNKRPKEHRFPGQKSIEQEFEMEPCSTRPEVENIDWEAYGVPAPDDGSRRGSAAEPDREVLSDELLAVEDAVVGDLPIEAKPQDSEAVDIEKLNLYLSSEPLQVTQEKDSGIQKQESGDSASQEEWGVDHWGENQNSGGQGAEEVWGQSFEEASKEDSEVKMDVSEVKDSEVKINDSEVKRQEFNPPNYGPRRDNSRFMNQNFSRPNSSRGGRGRFHGRHDSGVQRQYSRADILRNDPYFFNGRNPEIGSQDARQPEDSGRRRQDDQRGGYNGRHQNSPARDQNFGRDSGHHRRQDSPPRQYGRRSRSSSRSTSPYNGGFMPRRSTSRQGPSGDRGRPRTPEPVDRRHPEDRRPLQNPNERRQDLLNRHRRILMLLKNIFREVSYTKGMALRQILCSNAHHEIWEFMKDRDRNEMNVDQIQMDQIVGGLKAILKSPQFTFAEGLELEEILKEAGALEVWEFMNKDDNDRQDYNRQDQHHRQEDRQDQHHNDQDHQDRRQEVDRQLESPRSRQNQMNDRNYHQNRSPSPVRRGQRRQISPDRQREGSPIRHDQRQNNGGQNSMNPDGARHMSQDRRSNSSNQDDMDFDWEGFRMKINELLNRSARICEFTFHFEQVPLRNAIQARNYKHPLVLIQKCEHLRSLKARESLSPMMKMIRYEMSHRQNHRICVFWMEAMWRAGTKHN